MLDDLKAIVFENLEENENSEELKKGLERVNCEDKEKKPVTEKTFD
jgi:hypothetical protein